MLLATGGLSSFGMAQALDPSVQLLLLQQQVQFLVISMWRLGVHGMKAEVTVYAGDGCWGNWRSMTFNQVVFVCVFRQLQGLLEWQDSWVHKPQVAGQTCKMLLLLLLASINDKQLGWVALLLQWRLCHLLIHHHLPKFGACHTGIRYELLTVLDWMWIGFMVMILMRMWPHITVFCFDVCRISSRMWGSQSNKYMWSLEDVKNFWVWTEDSKHPPLKYQKGFDLYRSLASMWSTMVVLLTGSMCKLAMSGTLV